MGVKKLEIKLFEFCRPGKNISGMQFYRRADFLVNGERLSHSFEPLKTNPLSVSTQLDKNPPPESVIARFCGVIPEGAKPERFVLYYVQNAESDSLGSISCLIERDHKKIAWKDIRSEGLGQVMTYPDLVFDFEEYEAELKDYMERNPVTGS